MNICILEGVCLSFSSNKSII